jgi:hypothetical protein
VIRQAEAKLIKRYSIVNAHGNRACADRKFRPTVRVLFALNPSAKPENHDCGDLRDDNAQLRPT